MLDSNFMLDIPDFSGAGRLFEGGRRVCLGDVRPTGGLRVDALLRYAQDFSTEDTDNSGAADDCGWVVRSVQARVSKQAVYGETLSMKTACVGLGKRWAQRRIEIAGDRGAKYELAVLWICLDVETRRPKALSQGFLDDYAEAADGRIVSAKKVLALPEQMDLETDWSLRRTDFDVYGHMNNSAYGAVVEELAVDLVSSSSHNFVIEYLTGVESGSSIQIQADVTQKTAQIRYLHNNKTAASALVQAL